MGYFQKQKCERHSTPKRNEHKEAYSFLYFSKLLNFVSKFRFYGYGEHFLQFHHCSTIFSHLDILIFMTKHQGAKLHSTTSDQR